MHIKISTNLLVTKFKAGKAPRMSFFINLFGGLNNTKI